MSSGVGMTHGLEAILESRPLKYDSEEGFILGLQNPHLKSWFPWIVHSHLFLGVSLLFFISFAHSLQVGMGLASSIHRPLRSLFLSSLLTRLLPSLVVCEARASLEGWIDRGASSANASLLARLSQLVLSPNISVFSYLLSILQKWTESCSQLVNVSQNDYSCSTPDCVIQQSVFILLKIVSQLFSIG